MFEARHRRRLPVVISALQTCRPYGTQREHRGLFFATHMSLLWSEDQKHVLLFKKFGSLIIPVKYPSSTRLQSDDDEAAEISHSCPPA